jgi:hypothetical protein
MSMRTGAIAASVIATVLSGLWLGCSPTDEAGAVVHTTESDTDTYDIDRIYRSMRGPTDTKFVTIGEPGEDEPVWITGLGVEPLEPSGTHELEDGDQFICHVNVSHQDRNVWAQEMAKRQQQGRSVPFNWFTLVQGHYSIDFPEGFGLPAHTGQVFRVFSMAQNQDQDRKPFGMRIRSSLRYVYDRDLARPMTPLNKFSWDVRVAAPFFDGEKEIPHDESCANDETHGSDEAVLHFAVPPGRHVYRSTVNAAGKLPFDTTAHYISAHLHVYGESLELIDKTAGKSLFISRATNNARHTGIADMPHFSSVEGIPIYRNHEYELVATYDNTSGRVTDAMAVVYVYYRDEPPVPLATAG